MKNLKSGILALAILLVYSCTKDNGVVPQSEFFVLMDNSQIIHITSEEDNEVLHSFQIDGGENFVFQYQFNEKESSAVVDDEYGYTFTFEVDKDVESFVVEGTELEALKAHFREVGAWVSHRQVPVITGKVSGQKLASNRWAIQIDVKAESHSSGIVKEIVVDATFEK